MSRRARFPAYVYVILLVVVLFLGALPLLSVAGASVVASLGGCPLDEGSIHPCIIAGMDLGEQLYTAGVLGWLMLVTIPAGILASVGLGIIWLVHYLVWRRRHPMI
jgi:hypothetical protein